MREASDASGASRATVARWLTACTAELQVPSSLDPATPHSIAMDCLMHRRCPPPPPREENRSYWTLLVGAQKEPLERWFYGNMPLVRQLVALSRWITWANTGLPMPRRIRAHMPSHMSTAPAGRGWSVRTLDVATTAEVLGLPLQFRLATPAAWWRDTQAYCWALRWEEYLVAVAQTVYGRRTEPSLPELPLGIEGLAPLTVELDGDEHQVDAILRVGVLAWCEDHPPPDPVDASLFDEFVNDIVERLHGSGKARPERWTPGAMHPQRIQQARNSLEVQREARANEAERELSYWISWERDRLVAYVVRQDRVVGSYAARSNRYPGRNLVWCWRGEGSVERVFPTVSI